MRLKGLTPCPALSKAFQGNAFIYLAIAALTFAAYYITLDYPFVLDDHGYIAENLKIRSLKNLWPPYDSRYLGFASFAVNYRLSGLNPAWFRATNILIHIINSCLVFLLVRDTFAIQYAAAPDEHKNTGRRIAAISALIFALHPIQTESVTYITQRFASLATLFFLASIVLFIRFRASQASRKKRFLFFALSIVSAVMAQKTKEISFTLPAVIALYDFMFFGQKRGFKDRFITLLPFILCLAIVPISIFGPELGIGGNWGVGEEVRRQQLHEFAAYDRYAYLITQFRVIVMYLRLIVLPVGQSMHYDNRLFTTVLEPQVFLSLMFLLLMFGSSIWLLQRHKKTKNPFHKIIPFSVFWFFITLSIESSIVPIRDAAFEHRLYLPVMGIIIILASGLTYMINYLAATRRILLMSTAVITAALFIATYNRNLAWSDDVLIWAEAVKKLPGNVRARNNLGTAYESKGMLAEAVEEYKTALSLEPDDYLLRYNIANAFAKQGIATAAEKEFREAIRLKQDFIPGHRGLALLYKNAGRTDEAISEYEVVLRLDPADEFAHNDIGALYAKKGLSKKAIYEFNEALRIRGDFIEARRNLAVAYHDSDMLEQAITEYLAVLRAAPFDADIHNDLGSAYEEKGMKEKAIEEYRKALELTPENALIKENLRVLTGN